MNPNENIIAKAKRLIWQPIDPWILIFRYLKKEKIQLLSILKDELIGVLIN